MKVNRTIILTLFIISLVVAYDQINDYKEIMAYYEDYSYMPIIHVYHNRHFSKSKQFLHFVEVVEEAEYETKQYSKIVFTDCEIQKSDQNRVCKEIQRLNENRMIVGYQPSNQFTNFGDKIMQSPPKNKLFDHHSDVYTAEEIIIFINSFVPNFFRKINNIHEFQEFQKPKYAPKLIYATREEDIPQALKQLSVEFFLRFDMGSVEDLTQSVINQLQITKFPSLLVLKYNFELNKAQIFVYNSSDFSESSSYKIRNFLEKYALVERRNDYVFHFIKSNKQEAQIITVDKLSDLEQTLERTRGWVFLQDGANFNKLVELKNKYGQYYDYIHYLKPEVTEEKIYLINHFSKLKYEYNEEQFGYRKINFENFKSNSTFWLNKDYVVLGVKPAQGHICAIVDKALFAGLVHCFVIEQQAYDKVSQFLGLKYQYGFIVSLKKGTNKVKGNDIKNPQYESVHYLLQYLTRMKVKEILDDFLENPVKKIITQTSIQQLCAEPYKKCILYFHEKQSDNTKREYLELEALNYVNQYIIFEVDLKCNSHIFQQIPEIQKSSGGLIAYHPRVGKYVYLKAKMTREVIKKFLKINNEEKKTLPFRQFSKDVVPLYSCEIPKASQATLSNQQQQYFDREL